jgi:hypothetical protein
VFVLGFVFISVVILGAVLLGFKVILNILYR